MKLCEGVSGQIVMTQNADRLINYELWTLGPGNNTYYRYLKVDTSKPVGQVCLPSCRDHELLTNVLHMLRRSLKRCAWSKI